MSLDVQDVCYLDSIDNLPVIKRMVRTKFSQQRSVWYKNEKPIGDWETDREYFHTKFNGHDVFVKRILDMPVELGSISKFIENQVEKHKLLKDCPCVPKLYFYTNDAIGVQYIKGVTLKEWWYQGKFNKAFLAMFLEPFKHGYELAIQQLYDNNYTYDLSFNNILLDEQNKRFYFIDFDVSNRKVGIKQFINLMIGLAIGKLIFDGQGNLMNVKDIDKL